MKRYAKDAEKDLLRLGFDHIWTNTSGGRCYAHPDDPEQTEVVLNPGTNESGARAILQRARRIAGTHTPATGKRNAARAKQRAAAGRDRHTDHEHARTQAQQRVEYVAAKHQRLLAARAEPGAVTAAERLLEQRQAELDALERLMRQPPAGGHGHRGAGQARHYTGL